jgi:hypothetical protein
MVESHLKAAAIAFTVSWALMPMKVFADTNVDDSPAWKQCIGGRDLAYASEVQSILPQLVCYGSTTEGESAVRNRLTATSNTLAMSEYPLRAQIYLALMKISVAHGNRMQAAAEGRFARYLQKSWDGGRLSEEETVYWDMLAPDMRNTLLAHGGTRSDNDDARPDDWKSVDASKKQEMWVYKSGGAVTTYIFADGKLTQTIKP